MCRDDENETKISKLSSDGIKCDKNEMLMWNIWLIKQVRKNKFAW